MTKEDIEGACVCVCVLDFKGCVTVNYMSFFGNYVKITAVEDYLGTGL